MAKAKATKKANYSDIFHKYSRLIFALAIGLAIVIGVLAANNSSKEVNCSTEACFDPAFRNCLPATLDYTALALGSVYYQIQKANPNGSGCEMTFSYTANPNSAWINKPMTCTFNNKLSLEKSVEQVFDNLLGHQNTYHCSGPLVSIIQGINR